MMLLATNGTRAFGLNGPGALTARQALEAAGDGDRLTLEGMTIRAASLPDVLALAQCRVSVVALAVDDGATTEMISATGTEATTTMIVAPDCPTPSIGTPGSPTPSIGTPGSPQQLAMW